MLFVINSEVNDTNFLSPEGEHVTSLGRGVKPLGLCEQVQSWSLISERSV